MENGYEHFQNVQHYLVKYAEGVREKQNKTK